MMSDLQQKSIEFENVIKTMAAQTRRELDNVIAEIENCNTILASSEAKGDRSENAVFQIAKDTRDMKVGIQRIHERKLAALNNYNGDNTYVPDGHVKVGSTVEFRLKTETGAPFTDGEDRFIVKVVPHDLSRGSYGLMSEESRIGNSILGHSVGDEVLVTCLKGKIICKIERLY